MPAKQQKKVGDCPPCLLSLLRCVKFNAQLTIDMRCETHHHHSEEDEQRDADH